MAKLHSYYVLCPLIDQKSFLGVSEDKDHECVLVSLGRNVINKYRLSDQKQIGGWTSKDHITAPVIYDKDSEAYVGVFNNNIIKTWQGDEDTLDKVKKYKFPHNISRLVPRKHRASLIIFSNGNTASLTYALENRKNLESVNLFKGNEIILDAVTYVLNNTEYICYITKNEKNKYEIINCPLREELGDMEKAKLSKVNITRSEDVHIVGQLINDVDDQAVYILWSDAKMTVYNLIKKKWKTVGTVPWISTQSSVSMAWMGKNHLILFGSNYDCDGAIIVAYNVTLGVGSCRYPMKMYTEAARLYCFSSRIILEASNHIGVLPFVLDTERNISSLLGSHEVVQDEKIEIADWNTPTEMNLNICSEIEELLELGLNERRICSQVIPPLLEKDDFKSVLKMCSEFKEIHESVIVMLLNYAINLTDPKNINITDQEEFLHFCSSNSDKFEVLHYVFEIPFSDANIITPLTSSLNLDNCLFLMMYISHLLTNLDREINPDYENKLFDWYLILIEAFGKQFSASTNNKVTYVLEYTSNVINNLVSIMFDVVRVTSLSNNLLYGEVSDSNEESLSYSVVLMQI